MAEHLDIIQRPSPNFGDRRGDGVVDMLILHYTDMANAEEAVDLLCNPEAEVSAHYLIARDGRCFQMVDEAKRAWHAGVSYWAGETDVNSRSIGIELDNPGHRLGYIPFTEPQMQSLKALCQGLLSRHPIPPERVLGHSDIAPGRKRDPGDLFDWKALADAGIGRWPGGLSGETREELAAIGYNAADADEAELAAILEAYRWHWGEN